MLKQLFSKVGGQIITDLVQLRANKNKIYYICLKINRSYFFNYVISLSIIANAVVLAMDRYPIDEKESDTLEILNMIFFSIFLIELVIKLLSQGFKFYVIDKFNWFDSLVVLISSLDVILSYTSANNSGSGSGAISALRVFRLIRIF